VIADSPGPPDVLRPVNLLDDGPAAGQVVVAVEACAVTFVETQIRAGVVPPPPGTSFPLVLGNGVGGTVLAVGDGVESERWLGARVVTSTGGRGGYASRARAAVTDLHGVEAGLALHDALALLADGRTAVGLSRAANPGGNDVVVVTAAAGGVGGLLVQLAAGRGATVVGLASNDAKLARARELGAAATIGYTSAGWLAELDRVAPGGVDVVFDGVGGDTGGALLERLAPGARYVAHGFASGRWATPDESALARRGVTVVPLSSVATAGRAGWELTETALAEAAAGRLRPTIGQTYPLEQASRAHAAIEARAAIGKTLLLPGPADVQNATAALTSW